MFYKILRNIFKVMFSLHAKPSSYKYFSLQNIPDLSCIGDTLEELHLQRNLIENLNSSFIGLNRLIYLNLKENQITELFSFQFSTAPALDELNIRDNLIHTIHDNVFCGTNLTDLNLSGLYLTDYPDLACIANTLVSFEIDHQQSTGITNFEKATSLPNVDEINMEVNQMDYVAFDLLTREAVNFLLRCDSWFGVDSISVAFLQNATKLTFLGISSCRLVEIPDFRVIPTTNIIYEIDLDGNTIRSIDVDVFATLLRLETLTLRDCGLYSINDQAFTSLHNHLTVLGLQHNENLNLPSSFFINFTSISKFQAFDTNMTEFPNLSNSNQTLTYIGLNSINLDPFDTEQLLIYQNLRQIHLSGSLSENQRFANLTSLIVDGSLSVFDIRNNEIGCGCDAQWMKELASGLYGESYMGVLWLEDVICTTPHIFAGNSILEADETLCPCKIVCCIVTIKKCILRKCVIQLFDVIDIYTC